MSNYRGILIKASCSRAKTKVRTEVISTVAVSLTRCFIESAHWFQPRLWILNYRILIFYKALHMTPWHLRMLECICQSIMNIYLKILTEVHEEDYAFYFFLTCFLRLHNLFASNHLKDLCFYYCFKCAFKMRNIIAVCLQLNKTPS